MGHREPLVARLYTDLGMQSSATCQPILSRSALSAFSAGRDARSPPSNSVRSI